MKEIVRQIKVIHKDTLCIFKIGNFYHCYNRDAYILCYLFNYKLKCIEEGFFECGFPGVSLNKIISKLEEKKINYSIIDVLNCWRSGRNKVNKLLKNIKMIIKNDVTVENT